MTKSITDTVHPVTISFSNFCKSVSLVTNGKPELDSIQRAGDDCLDVTVHMVVLGAV